MTTTLQALIGGRQHARLLRLSFPEDDAPPAELLVERLDAVESLSRDFRYTVELLSDEANLRLEELQGKLMCVSLVRADGSLRHFTGRVHTFRHVRTDGGIAFYEAVLVPWLYYLTLRQNNRLFHTQTLQQQIQTLLAEYGPLPAWEWKVTGEQPEFTMCTQWSESDHNYVHRRLEAAGYVFHYEHTEKGHTWQVYDDTRDLQPIDGAPEIRFHSHSGAEDEDAIAQWSPRRQWASGHSGISGFDFKNPQPVHVGLPTVNEQGDVPKLEVHSYEGHYGFKHRAGAEQLARQRMEEIEARGKQFEAQGNCARVMPGRWFRLTDHFGHHGEDAEFLILEARHEARNNYLQGDGGIAEYKNRFVCQGKAVVWRPGRGFNSQPTQILAPQTATVVGPQGTGSLHVDEYGRVQVQFHWDREQSGSCWVRVATNWAGGEKGLASHPRVGSEAVIQFLDGNPDHPLVTACVHNQAHMPPWKLPEQRALTGLRSRELTPDGGNSAGGRSNHLLLDDTADKIQVQLKSDHQASQLSLGHITRIEDTAGRKDARGQGFELRTDGHGAVRAKQGLLLTTEERLNARAHTTDLAETVERLRQGQDLHQSLSDAAKEAQAHQAGDQDEVVKALQAQTADIKGSGGNPAEGEFPEFQAPHLTLASPAGIQATTQGSTHVVSAEHTALTSGGHVSLSAGKSLLASVKDAVRLFAYKAGMKLVAATSDIDITALKDSVNLLAKLNITHTANRITITAKEEVVINGGGSFTTWGSGGVTHGTRGPWKVQATGFSHNGPASLGPPRLPQATQLPVGQLDLYHHYLSQAGAKRLGIRGGEYRVIDSECGEHSGTLDANGQASVSGLPMGMVQVVYGEDPSDPWDAGSYFGAASWPAEVVPGTTSTTSATPAASVQATARAASAMAGSTGGIAGGGAALGGAAVPIAAAALLPATARLASSVALVQQAIGAAQAVKTGGAGALLPSAARVAATALAQRVPGAAPALNAASQFAQLAQAASALPVQKAEASPLEPGVDLLRSFDRDAAHGPLGLPSPAPAASPTLDAADAV